MGEIPEIKVGEIEVLLEEPSVALPQVPPVTLELGVPVINMPAFEPMDVPQDAPPVRVVPPKTKSEPPEPAAPKLPAIKPPGPPVTPKPVEEKPAAPLAQQIVEALPTIPQATTVAVSSVIGVSAGLATPFLLKLIKPTVKKVMTKIQKSIGLKVKVQSVFQRQQAQRALRK